MDNNFEILLLGKEINKGGLNLYRYSDALLLIDLCNKNGVRVLGIDGFDISDGYTHPLMEHSVDFSTIELANSNEAAYNFLVSRKKLDLVYEIIY